MSTLSVGLLMAAVVVAALYLLSHTVLSLPKYHHYDKLPGTIHASHPDEQEQRKLIIKQFASLRKELQKSGSLKQALILGREYADNLSQHLITDSVFKIVKNDHVNAEWVIPANIKSNRRLLFFHGGAFIVGSAKGHRCMADKLAKLSNAAVLSVNYRMLPEHGRMKSVIDAHNAYRWILDNGPDGPGNAEQILISGDSAGGNLALMVSRWCRTTQQTADAVICFSPSADNTLSSPTIIANKKTDPVLGLGIGLLMRVPVTLRNLIGAMVMRANPASPLLSPVAGDLSDLPPTLILASDNEMLLGESVRYTNEAQAAGSPVTLHVWNNQIHDWPLFFYQTDIADSAWQSVDEFIQHTIR